MFLASAYPTGMASPTSFKDGRSRCAWSRHALVPEGVIAAVLQRPGRCARYATSFKQKSPRSKEAGESDRDQIFGHSDERILDVQRRN